VRTKLTSQCNEQEQNISKKQGPDFYTSIGSLNAENQHNTHTHTHHNQGDILMEGLPMSTKIILDLYKWTA
jgi:hypothetical protein